MLPSINKKSNRAPPRVSFWNGQKFNGKVHSLQLCSWCTFWLY